MSIGTFYNPFADPQDRTPVSHCSKCRREIYQEDPCYLYQGCVLCADCGDENYDSMETGRELELYFQKLYGGNHE